MNPQQKCVSTGKVCHTKAEAQKTAQWVKRSTVSLRRVHAYRCDDWKDHPPGAGHFHVGHVRIRKARR